MTQDIATHYSLADGKKYNFKYYLFPRLARRGLSVEWGPVRNSAKWSGQGQGPCIFGWIYRRMRRLQWNQGGANESEE